jgi:hypothetical protein
MFANTRMHMLLCPCVLCAHRSELYEVAGNSSSSINMHDSDPAAVAAQAVAAAMEFGSYSTTNGITGATVDHTAATATAAASTTSSGLSALSGLSGLSAALGLSSSPLNMANGLSNGLTSGSVNCLVNGLVNGLANGYSGGYAEAGAGGNSSSSSNILPFTAGDMRSFTQV